MSTVATLAGGCFWCHDALYRQVKGVTNVTSGYCGGDVENPSYEQVSTGTTGHAECVQIEFDPEVIPYDVLLKIFWATHDPTTPNRDGANVGTQYRSEVFYHNDQQRRTAEQVLSTYAQKLWNGKVVTKISPFTQFYPAEEYHQDYYNKNPLAGYCQVVINPKLAKFQEQFKDWLNG